MNKSFRKVLSVFLIVAVLTSCLAVSASAATARTNTYYVYQEESYGQLTLTRSSLLGTTYCELNRAGKIAKVNFWVNEGGEINTYSVQAGGNYNTDYFIENTNYSSNFTEAAASAPSGEYFTKAQSYHKVKVTSYVIWDSAQCDGNTNGYDIPTINL